MVRFWMRGLRLPRQLECRAMIAAPFVEDPITIFSRPLYRNILFLALSLALGGWFAAAVYWDLGRVWCPLDDAFIYAQYARQMAAGRMYEYYPGEGVSSGVTSPLYPWLLVPAFWLKLGGERIVWVWHVYGVAWRLWTALLVFALVRSWTRNWRPAMAAALFALMSRAFNWGVSSGMETGMISVLLMGSLLAGQKWLRLAEMGARARAGGGLDPETPEAPEAPDTPDTLEIPGVPRTGPGKERRALAAFVIWLGLLAVSRPEGTVTAVLAWFFCGYWLMGCGSGAAQSGPAGIQRGGGLGKSDGSDGSDGSNGANGAERSGAGGLAGSGAGEAQGVGAQGVVGAQAHGAAQAQARGGRGIFAGIRAWLILSLAMIPLALWHGFLCAKTGSFSAASGLIKTAWAMPGMGWAGAAAIWLDGMRQTFDWDFLGFTGIPIYGGIFFAMGCGAMLWPAWQLRSRSQRSPAGPDAQISFPPAPLESPASSAAELPASQLRISEPLKPPAPDAPDQPASAINPPEPPCPAPPCRAPTASWRRPSARLPLLWLAGLAIPALSPVPFINAARYQAAHLPLFLAIAVYGAWTAGLRLPRMRTLLWGGIGLYSAAAMFFSLAAEARRFAMNSEDMWFIQRAAAQWIRQNTKTTDRIAVTDAGIIPYLSERPSLDLIGLTNRSMLNVLNYGPGANWHAIERLSPAARPRYFAMFPAWFDATSLGGAAAEIRADRSTIAVGNQITISRFEPSLPWTEKRVPPEAREAAIAPKVDAWALRDWVDMADLTSEKEHLYRCADQAKWQRLQFCPLTVAQLSSGNRASVTDGGRVWTSFEEFRLRGLRPAEPLRLVLRTMGDKSRKLRIFIDRQDAGTLSIEPSPANAFGIVRKDFEGGAYPKSSDPLIRFELIRDGGLGEAAVQTSYMLWALQPARDGETTPSMSHAERAIEDQYALERAAWADRWLEGPISDIPIECADRVLWGPGWADYAQKESDGRWARWLLGREGVLRVPSPRPARDMAFEAQLAPYLPPPPPPSPPAATPLPSPPPGAASLLSPSPSAAPAAPNRLRARIAGRLLAEWTLEPGIQTYRCHIPAEAFSGEISELTLEFDQSHIPANVEPGSTDARSLAARFFRISIQ